jgi:hypothetical protein
MGSSPVNPPHAPSQPIDILLPHNLTAASVPMYVLLSTLGPVWVHCSITVITSLIPILSPHCAARLRYNGPLIELVLYGGNDFDSSWWPLDHERTFNDLVNVADGCKVPLVAWQCFASPAALHARLGTTQFLVILASGDLKNVRVALRQPAA